MGLLKTPRLVSGKDNHSQRQNNEFPPCFYFTTFATSTDYTGIELNADDSQSEETGAGKKVEDSGPIEHTYRHQGPPRYIVLLLCR